MFSFTRSRTPINTRTGNPELKTQMIKDQNDYETFCKFGNYLDKEKCNDLRNNYLRSKQTYDESLARMQRNNMSRTRTNFGFNFGFGRNDYGNKKSNRRNVNLEAEVKELKVHVKELDQKEGKL